MLLAPCGSPELSVLRPPPIYTQTGQYMSHACQQLPNRKSEYLSPEVFTCSLVGNRDVWFYPDAYAAVCLYLEDNLA